jgi:hypothetical protein
MKAALGVRFVADFLRAAFLVDLRAVDLRPPRALFFGLDFLPDEREAFLPELFFFFAIASPGVWIGVLHLADATASWRSKVQPRAPRARGGKLRFYERRSRIIRTS